MAAVNEPSPPDPCRHSRVPALRPPIPHHLLPTQPADNGLERFMDTQGFGVRFLLTTIGVLLKLYPAP